MCGLLAFAVCSNLFLPLLVIGGIIGAVTCKVVAGQKAEKN